MGNLYISLLFVNRGKADKLCLLKWSASAAYTLLLIACVTILYTKCFNSSQCKRKHKLLYVTITSCLHKSSKTTQVNSVKTSKDL